MPELPSGAVTFLFTDIEGSTALWERDGAAMAAARALPRHQATPLDPFLDVFRAIHDNRPAPVTFADAVRVQAVLEAAEQSAASGGSWIEPAATA